jgi:hypothetical protein
MTLPLDTNGNPIPELGTAAEPIIIVTNDTTAPAVELDPGPYEFSSYTSHYGKAGVDDTVVASSSDFHVNIGSARPWQTVILAGMNWVSFKAAAGTGVVAAVKKTWP